MKFLFKLSLIFFLGCLMTTGYGQVVKLATVAPEGSPWVNALKELADSWRKISNGRIRVRIYPGGVAGDESDIIRKMRIGQLHAAALTSSGISYLSSDVTALTFPINIKTDAELEYVISKVGGDIENQIKKKGFQVLSWSNCGWVHFFSKQKIVTPDDMKKCKLFFWGSKNVYIELLKKTGFNPIPLSITDLLPSLQTGLVDSFASPPQAALAFQWYPQAPNMSAFRWQPLPAIIVVSTRKWRQLPSELKPALIKSAVKISKKLEKTLQQMEVSAIKAMEKRGLKVIPTPEAALLQWKKLVMTKGLPVFLKKCFSRSMFDKVQKATAEYRQIMKKKSQQEQ